MGLVEGSHDAGQEPAGDAAVRLVTVLALLLLLWQVASQIRLNSAYVAVLVALVVYVAGSAALGWVLALRAPAAQATEAASAILTTGRNAMPRPNASWIAAKTALTAAR